MQRTSQSLLMRRAAGFSLKVAAIGSGSVGRAAAGIARRTAHIGHTPSRVLRQRPLHPAATVPTASSAANSAERGAGVLTAAALPMRKKVLLRRIVKRKKTIGSAPPAAAAPTGASAATTGAAEPVATVAPPSEPKLRPSAPPVDTTAAVPRRAHSMLQSIRRDAESKVQTQRYEAPRPRIAVETAEEAAPAPEAADEDTTSGARSSTNLRNEPRSPSDEPGTYEDPPSPIAATSSAASSPSPTAEAAAAAGTRKTAMVRGYRIDEVMSLCTPSDAIFARRLPAGGCQFFAWPGTPLRVASAAIVSMPDTIRTVHALFGRLNTPIDMVMDIDCQVPQEYWSMTKIRPFQNKVLDDVLSVVQAELTKIGETIETQVVLQSPNLKKASFHVHTRLKDAAFADYESLYGFLAPLKDKIPNVDMQIYRPNGMLRMFSCMKENRTSAMVVFDEPKWNIGFSGGKVPDEEAALHSICVRDPSTYSRLLRFEPPRSTTHQRAMTDDAESDETGDADTSKIPPAVLMPLSPREAVETASRWLRQATEVEVSDWRTWIGLGICAYRVGYNFKDARNLQRPAMEEMLDAWCEASRHCQVKYHPGECEAKWVTFDPHKLTSTSDWWSAYRRLGRLEAAVQEARRNEEQRNKKHQRRWKVLTQLNDPEVEKETEKVTSVDSADTPSTSAEAAKTVAMPPTPSSSTTAAPTNAGAGANTITKLKAKKRVVRRGR